MMIASTILRKEGKSVQILNTANQGSNTIIKDEGMGSTTWQRKKKCFRGTFGRSPDLHVV